MNRLILFFIFFPTFASAQVILNLHTCREMALQNSKEMAIADKQRQKALYEERMYKANYFPKVSMVGMSLYQQKKYNYTLKGGYLPTYKSDAEGKLVPDVMINPETEQPFIGEDGHPVFNMYAFLPDIKLQLNLRGVYTSAVQLEQPIYWGGKIRKAHRMAEIGGKLAAENVRLNRAEVLLQTEQAYWQLLQVEEQVLATMKYKEVVSELLKDLKEAQEVGMVTSNETLKAVVRYNEADLMLQKAQNGRTLARMNLCRLLGLDLDTEICVQDSLTEDIPAEVWRLDSTILHRPDFQLLEFEMELKTEQIALERSDFLPHLEMSIGCGYSGGVKLNGENETGTTWTALAALKIPVFHWGEGRNKIRSAKMDEEISRLTLEKSSDLMRLEVHAARFNLQDAQTRVNMARHALCQAVENLKVSRDQYQVGTENLAALLEAQAQWQKMWSQWIGAKAKLHLGVAIYLKSIGKLE